MKWGQIIGTCSAVEQWWDIFISHSLKLKMVKSTIWHQGKSLQVNTQSTSLHPYHVSPWQSYERISWHMTHQKIPHTILKEQLYCVGTIENLIKLELMKSEKGTFVYLVTVTYLFCIFTFVSFICKSWTISTFVSLYLCTGLILFQFLHFYCRVSSTRFPASYFQWSWHCSKSINSGYHL